MEDDFIPYSEALALKELGFDKECLAWYNNKGIDADLHIYGHDCLADSMSNNEGNCNAPTCRAAERWFRYKYNLYLPIKRDYDKNGYYYYFKHNPDGSIHATYCYDDAELEQLRELINQARLLNK